MVAVDNMSNSQHCLHRSLCKILLIDRAGANFDSAPSGKVDEKKLATIAVMGFDWTRDLRGLILEANSLGISARACSNSVGNP